MTVHLLQALGHNAMTAAAAGLARASDELLLRYAREQGRILVTRDKGFGALVYLREEDSSGVILLRVDPPSIDSVHSELVRLLGEHTEAELQRCIAVVEPGRYRMRRIPQRPAGPPAS
jgi:predicted nuclease of predicted toxin-antitoxin system